MRFLVLLAGFLAYVWLDLIAEAEDVKFDRAFAPQEGLVSQYEEPLRQEICLNGLWRFQGDTDTSIPGETIPPLTAWDKTEIKIPSPWNVNGFFAGKAGGDFRAYPTYPKEWENLRAAWMEKMLSVPRNWEGKRIVLHFGAVAGKMVVYVNGQWVGGGFDIFFPQEFDVTKMVRFGAKNQILVKVIAPKVFDKPGPFGRREYLSGSFWGTFIAGIWQDVFLLAEPKVNVSDVFVQPWVNRDALSVETTMANHGSTPITVTVSGDVREWINEAGNSVLQAPEVKWRLARKSSIKLGGQEITIAPGESRMVTLAANVDGHLKLWSPNAPNLYGLLLTVSSNGKPVDVKYQRFGWRQFTLDGNKLLLNGQPITLRGDSWHFLGVPQMTRRYACAWYRLLKDAGANAVRLHASIYPTFYHDTADEMGILILDESAIWASDGGPKADSDIFWRNCRTNVAELVLRDRNHPSIFGWSVCNEILPVLRNVWHAPPGMLDHCMDQISTWEDICRTDDPTRPWISGDGEWDADGRLPVINIHYGGDGDMQRASDSGKPWAVGETSMAYYGTPRQVSHFNGDQAYDSDLGRMKGLAYECYSLLRDQQKYGADYQSVFNIAWYSVQPLPFGKRNLATPVSLDDGIFFGPYKEGVPGMQPERLGAYTSTLNPGYDPALPLYRPWPMFDAIHDANTDITNSPWAHHPELCMPPTVPIPPATATASYVPENGNRLAQELSRCGVKLSTYANGVKTDFLLVDGSSSEIRNTTTLKNAVDNVLGQGGTVWIWNITPVGAPAVSQLLGQEVSAEPRQASSFIVKQNVPLLAGLDNAKLYFSEDDDWRQIDYSLSGALVSSAQVVLEACPADWRMWNYQAEPVKTAALYRSEAEHTTPLAAIAVVSLAKGRVILCNLNPQIRSTKKSEVVARLFQNERIPLGQITAQNGYLDADGRLLRALVCGSFGVADPHDAYNGKLPTGEIHEDASLDDHLWKTCEANAEGIFDFKKGLVHGPQENAYAYLAIWIKSPKPLNDLLSEPNLPKLSFTYGTDDGCQVWLNGELLASHERIGPLDPEGFSINPLLLKLGWNQLVIKVVQAGGEWKFAGKFDCSDLNFLSSLQIVSTPPYSK